MNAAPVLVGYTVTVGLPGRRARTVISEAAFRELTPEQLGAVPEHGQASDRLPDRRRPAAN
ncbi:MULTISPECIES: M48 family metalloprotease [Streptomyces]|uniref:hypothetical protein n=1 Tax=Streptomyces TaxID=1883 RepID=UPI00163DAC12|nr:MULTISPECIES: hypothetical protein [unclassified Streptomyces]